MSLFLQRDKDSTGWLPLKTKGRCYYFVDHLYHKECVAKRRTRSLKGCRAKAILDWYYYGQLIPDFVFDGQDTPDEVFAAAFAVGYGVPENIAPSYTSGILLGFYKFEEGGFFLNTFPILDQLDHQNPAADRMLLNLVQYVGHQVDKPLVPLPRDFNSKLKDIGYLQ